VEHASPLSATEPGVQDSRAADTVPYPLTPTAPPQPASSPSIESFPSAHDAQAIAPKDSSSLQQTTTSADSHVAALSQAKSDKVDYGWLADLMAKWIGELDKRYPTILRTEGVTGRVTLTALLHQDGILSDVRVVKSSGNTLLDQVAVEDITNGPPVKLSRPLQRPSMPVKFSIVYDLKSAR
jgi:TonB family protein